MKKVILAPILLLMLCPLIHADSAPRIILNGPADNFLSHSSNISLEFTAIDDTDTNMSCFLLINSDIAYFYVINNTKYTHHIEELVQTSYEWNVTCSDDTGHNSTSESRVFSIDYTPPIIASVTILSLNNESASIRIITDEKTKRKIDYGLSPTNLYLTTNFTNLYYMHLPIILSNLSSGTTYYYNVTVCDMSGFCAKGKMTYTFTTLGNRTVMPDIDLPEPVNESLPQNTTMQNMAESNTLNSTLNETMANKGALAIFTKSTFNTLIVAAVISLVIYFIAIALIRKKNRL